MKQFNFKPRKLILSGLLVAVLSSQYYYSFSSISLGSMDFASEAARSAEAIDTDIREVNRFMQHSQKPEQKPYLDMLKLRLAALAKEKTALTAASPAAKDDIKALTSEQLGEKIKQLNTMIAEKSKGTSDDDKRQLQILVKVRESLVKEVAERRARAAAAAKPAVTEPDNQTGEAAAAARTSTEAKTVTIFCAECPTGGLSVTGTEAEIAKIANALSKKVAAASATVAASADATKKEEVKLETAAERRERERDERQAKRDEAEAKRQEIRERKEAKVKEAREKNNWAFEDKVEEITDRCGEDFSCKAERFAQLTKDFRGTKKVDPYVVNKAYNEIIDKDLKAILRGEDGSAAKTQAFQTLETLIGGIPTEYRGLKTKTIDSLKHAQLAQAQSVNSLYRQADAFAKQNKPTESVQTYNQAQRDDMIFRRDLDSASQHILSGLETNRDAVTYDYFRNTYAPDMKKIVSQLYNLSGMNLNSTATTTSTTLNGTTTSTNGRGGRTGSTTVTQPLGSTSIGTTTNGLGSVQFGRQQASPQGTRTGTQPRQ